MILKINIDSFSYSEKTILKNIYLSLNPGEHLSVLGESGCGKSTLLHLIYGLLHLDHGAIFYGKRELLGPGNTLIPGEPFMKLVAQEFNIMPFTTVAENLGSHLTRLDEERDENRIDELLEVVEMESFKNTLAKNLSGGQKQRVSLAKALANQPKILLLDEPFSNIDSFRKNKLRRKLFNHLKEKNISCITATHDSEEALAFSDKIVMLKNGTVEMYGTAEKVFNNVSDEYQAGFFDEVNLLPQNLFNSELSSEEIVVFPHELQISTEETQLKVQVEKCYFKGHHYLIQSSWKDKMVFFEHSRNLEISDILWLKYFRNSSI